jgi:hypothetical protein
VDGKRNIFARGDWTTQISLNRFSKFSFARMQFLTPQSLPGEAASRKAHLICPTGKSGAVSNAPISVAERSMPGGRSLDAACLGKADIPGPRGHVG